MSGYGLFSFMDTFSRYSQIQMNPRMNKKCPLSQIKGFITIRWCPLTWKMLDLHTSILSIRLSKIILVIVFRVHWWHVGKELVGRASCDRPQENFLNLEKTLHEAQSNQSAFGISCRKFLGFMVSHRGIEANLVALSYLGNDVAKDPKGK